MLTRRRASLLLLAMISVIPQAATACNVPVFRYALERWTADPYQIVLFHHGPIDQQLQKVVEVFAPADLEQRQPANFEFRTVDVPAIDQETRTGRQDAKLWEALGRDNREPWLVLYYPLSVPDPAPLLEARPTIAEAKRWLTSPARSEVAKRIVKGDTAVWLFLPGTNAEKNAAAWKELQAGLNRAKNELKIPPPDPQDVANGLISVDQATLEIRFSSLELDRNAPDERALVAMLLNSEADLLNEEFREEPIAFAVFGRGRSLLALVGEGISETAVFADGQFLCGACTCEIKGQNPGLDLLMTQDWDRLINPQIAIDTATAPLPSLTGFKSEPSGTANGGADQSGSPAEPAENPANGTANESSGNAADSPTGTDSSNEENSSAASGTKILAPTDADRMAVPALSFSLFLIGGVLLAVVIVGGLFWKLG